MRKRATMLTAAVIAIIAGFSCVGFKMMVNRKDDVRRNNTMSPDKAHETIVKSLGNVEFVDNYTIIKMEEDDENDIVSGILVQDNTDDVYNIWRVNKPVSENILVGFLFDEDEEVVWATEQIDRDFVDSETLQLELDYSSKEFHDDMNFKDGDFAWVYEMDHGAYCISDKEATSIWAYDKETNSVSLVWYNARFDTNHAYR